MNITDIIDKHAPIGFASKIDGITSLLTRTSVDGTRQPVYTRSTVEKMLGEVEQWLPIETAQNPSQTLVMRTGDMCQVSRLMVVIDGEGDVGVRTTGKNMVEFCTAQGGGRSPRTREALLALMVAIEADAAEREQLTSITHVETSIYAAPSPAKEQG